MDIAIITFDGFNELDSFISLGILNRMKKSGWRIAITSPSESLTSMNGVHICAPQLLEFANHADAVLFGSGVRTRDIARDNQVLSRLHLNPQTQLIGWQCSGTLLMAVLGLLDQVPACTDLATKPYLLELGLPVLEQAFYAEGNIATAGGCLSSQYLAAWVLGKLAGRSHAESVIHYVAPVGEKEYTVKHCMSVVGKYL
ncbi:MAG: AraC family transcriptional regulator [Spirochaetota bacterium]